MTYEWDAKKAAANLRKHEISFDEAASVFLDPLALTFPDSDHSAEEQREIGSCSSRNASGEIASASLARLWRS